MVTVRGKINRIENTGQLRTVLRQLSSDLPKRGLICSWDFASLAVPPQWGINEIGEVNEDQSSNLVKRSDECLQIQCIWEPIDFSSVAKRLQFPLIRLESCR